MPRFKVGDIVRYNYFTPEFIEKYKNHTYRIVEIFFGSTSYGFTLLCEGDIIIVENNELTPEAWFDVQLQRKN